MDESSPDVASRVRKILQQRLESLRRAGVTHVPRARLATSDASPPRPVQAPPVASRPARDQRVAERPLAEPAPVARHAPPPPVEIPPPPETKPRIEPASPTDAAAALRVLQKEVAGCTRCAELAQTRTQTVFGVGNPNPRIVFMGEAPGFDEDRQGEPFVGAAGQLLTKIIENGMGMRREEVYILNTLKCRPPRNRTPAPDEVENCRGFFEQQLDILKPEYIICLGAVAAQNLLETKQAVGKLRGRFHDYRGIKVMVTYHPAYLLRNPDDKRKTWDDIKMLLRQMEAGT